MPRLPEFETPVADHCAVSMAAPVVAGWAGIVAAALAADRAALDSADWALDLVVAADPRPTGGATSALARDLLPRVTQAQAMARHALGALARTTWEVC